MDDCLSDIIINNISEIITVNLPKGISRKIIRTTDYGILIAFMGAIRYKHNNTRYLSDEDHILFIPREITYHLTCLEESVTTVINFKADISSKIEEIISFNVNYKKTAGILNRIDNLWTFKKTSYRLHCISGIYEILAILNKHRDLNYLPKAKLSKIRLSVEYLESHYTDSDLTNEKLAKFSGISTVYFRKLFTQKFGIPPMKYITTKRIEKAQSLLKNQYYSSITNIAYAVGFNSLYYFCKVFKQETSYTPSQFAKLYIQNENK